LVGHFAESERRLHRLLTGSARDIYEKNKKKR
jgi:hypothetical protein